jgi:hypothetical protein
MYLKGIGVSVAVLAACATAEVEREFPWSSVARALVEIGIPAVVGMQFRIENKSAFVFLRMFYRTLASGASIGDAVVEGRKAMFTHDQYGNDFGVPVLYLRNSDNANTVVFPADIAEARAQTTAVETNIQAADGYKRLHDALHRAKFDAYNFMLDLERDFPPPAGRGRDLLTSCQRKLADCARDMRVVAREGRCDPELVQPLLDAFNDGLAQFDKAILGWDKDAFDASILTFDPMFRFEMTRLDGSILDRVQALPKGDGLAVLSEDEQRIAQLSQLFDAMRSLVAGQLTERTQTLDSALADSDTSRVSSTYWEFRYLVDRSFYQIDEDLRKLCSQVNDDLRASIAG